MADRGLIPKQPLAIGQRTFESVAKAIELAIFRGRNEHTVRSVQKSLELFGEFVGASGFLGITKALLGEGQGPANLKGLEFRNWLSARGNAPSTVNNRLHALGVLAEAWRFAGVIEWSVDLHYIPVEAYRDTTGPGTKKFADAMKLLEREKGPMALRDRAILVLLHDGALRRGEVSSLDLEHYDPGGLCLWVKAKKRTERVRIDLAPEMKQAIEAWLEIRGRKPGPLFFNFDRSKRSARLSDRSIARITHRRGVGRPHGIRHLAIGEYSDATNGNVEKVSKFARHKDPKVTMVYLDSLKKRDAEASKVLAKYRKGLKKGV